MSVYEIILYFVDYHVIIIESEITLLLY